MPMKAKADRTYRVNQVWVDFGKKNISLFNAVSIGGPDSQRCSGY